MWFVCVAFFNGTDYQIFSLESQRCTFGKNISAGDAILKQELFSFQLTPEGLILIVETSNNSHFIGDIESAKHIIVKLLCENGIPFSIYPFNVNNLNAYPLNSYSIDTDTFG